MESWNISKSATLYGINSWGEGYFDINADGHIVVRPDKGTQTLDLYEIVRSLVARGINVPVLLRFDGIIRDRVRRLRQAFSSAMTEAGYKGSYRPVFPIKVNQQRHVVDTVREAGRESALGLEVGSKPELIAVLAIHDTPDALLLCNGYKDREYIELALLSRKLGRRTIIIVEQLSELDQIAQISRQLGIAPEIGIRMKPISRGAGKWESSGGDRAKFGLNTSEIMMALEYLAEHGVGGWLKLLHFHVGSQITSIASIKKVLREATRMYTELAKLQPTLTFFDVGGGLAVDYDGSKTNFHSSMDYTPEEYARDVVWAIRDACDAASLPHPSIVTETGRATVAHHAVLVAQVIDDSPTHDPIATLESPVSEDKALRELYDSYANLTVKNCLETLHDGVGIREDVNQRFISGDISLKERAWMEKAFWHLMAKVRRVSLELKYRPEEIEKLDDELKDTFFCNFSVFQSLPDSWAVDQLFPIAPLARLKEEPTRRCTLADMSCDSDGKIDKFIDLKDVKSYLNVHPLREREPYYLGIFIVGAYQEILGDLHNLFGDTNAVHVDINGDGQVKFTHVIEGDTVREALKYVQYDTQDLQERLRHGIERALENGTLTNEDSAKLQKRYREALEGYTYLCVDAA